MRRKPSADDQINDVNGDSMVQAPAAQATREAAEEETPPKKKETARAKPYTTCIDRIYSTRPNRI